MEEYKKLKDRIRILEEALQWADTKLCDCINTLPCGSLCSWCSETSDANLRTDIKKRRKEFKLIEELLSSVCIAKCADFLECQNLYKKKACPQMRKILEVIERNK